MPARLRRREQGPGLSARVALPAGRGGRLRLPGPATARGQADEAVCTDQQQTFPSACLAECAHATNWREGRCDDAPVCRVPPGVRPGLCRQRDAVQPLRGALRAAAAGAPGRARPVPAARYTLEHVLRARRGLRRRWLRGRLCSAERSASRLSADLDELQCYATAGDCACRNNRCGFAPTREVERCLDALPSPAARRRRRAFRRTTGRPGGTGPGDPGDPTAGSVHGDAASGGPSPGGSLGAAGGGALATAVRRSTRAVCSP